MNVSLNHFKLILTKPDTGQWNLPKHFNRMCKMLHFSLPHLEVHTPMPNFSPSFYKRISYADPTSLTCGMVFIRLYRCTSSSLVGMRCCPFPIPAGKQRQWPEHRVRATLRRVTQAVTKCPLLADNSICKEIINHSAIVPASIRR